MPGESARFTRISYASLMALPSSAERPGHNGLLGRWVVANATGELVGLGGVGLVAAALVPVVQRHLPGNAARPLGTAVVMVVLGAFEGTVVGLAQARALRGTDIEARAWVRATILGAMLAWALGMVPSTVMALHTGPVPPGAGPPPWVRGLLAAALGLVAGPVLAAFQLPVLQGHARRPWRWLLANALGWAVGMPLVFAAVRNLALHGAGPSSVVRSASGLALAGAAVGWVEGVFLVRLLRPRGPGAGPENI